MNFVGQYSIELSLVWLPISLFDCDGNFSRPFQTIRDVIVSLVYLLIDVNKNRVKLRVPWSPN